jgi:hypothetical protein
MPLPALIVCEPSGLWAAALRQASTAEPLPLVETRRAADVLDELTAAPASLVALAWSAERRAELAALADRIHWRFRRARLVVLLDRRATDDRWLARELGAMHVCHSPRQVADVVGLARRHLGPRMAEAHWPAIDRQIEGIWQTLPWNS